MIKDFKVLVFLFPILLLNFCSTHIKSVHGTAEFIQKSIEKDTLYLTAFKKRTDINWSADWKLVKSGIDAYEATVAIKGEVEKIVPDTNCLLEWNNTHGKIRREIYNKSKIQNVDLLFYKDDSIYARGKIVSSSAKNKLQEVMHLKNKVYCKPCEDYTYSDYISAGSGATKYEEYQVLNSLDIVECSYTSFKFVRYSMRENSEVLISVQLYSDTIVTSEGTCPFVELIEQ